MTLISMPQEERTYWNMKLSKFDYVQAIEILQKKSENKLEYMRPLNTIIKIYSDDRRVHGLNMIGIIRKHTFKTL